MNMPTPPGVPGRDDVARLEREGRADELDQERDVEDEVVRVRLLADLAVDLEGDRRVGGVELRRESRSRAHRREGVAALAAEPLLVAALKVRAVTSLTIV
jgi:hypothetical protein